MENSIIVLKLISAVYLFVLLPVYIVRAGKNGRVEAPKSKLALSVVFCAVGLIGATLNDFSIYAGYILLGLMAVKSMTMIYFSPYAMQSRLLMVIGAILFIASDIFLAKYEYMNGNSKHRILNNITYFTGQLLIAASLFYT